MSDTGITVDRSFSTPICNAKLTGFKAHQEGLVAYVHQLREKTEGIQSSNYKGWHSHRFLHADQSDPHIVWLVRKLTGTIVRTLIEVSGEEKGVDIRFRELWVNINGKGEWNMPHIHPVHWAGVVYVTGTTGEEETQDHDKKMPFKDGDTVFQNPVEPATYFGQKASLNFSPETGAMLLFPGYLRHMVIPHQKDEERITFAFNIDHVKKKTPSQKSIPEEEQRREVNVVLD